MSSLGEAIPTIDFNRDSQLQLNSIMLLPVG